jgi:hypothetical protein
VKRYAKKREAVRAVQWRGEMTAEIRDLIGMRLGIGIERQQLTLGKACARVGDWILSSSGEYLTVIDDAVFRRFYEEVDPAGLEFSQKLDVVFQRLYEEVVATRVAPPTDAEHEKAGMEFTQKLDAVLVDALRLSSARHPGIWRDRDTLLGLLRNLLEDHSFVTARRERVRICEKIAKEL